MAVRERPIPRNTECGVCGIAFSITVELVDELPNPFMDSGEMSHAYPVCVRCTERVQTTDGLLWTLAHLNSALRINQAAHESYYRHKAQR